MPANFEDYTVGVIQKCFLSLQDKLQCQVSSCEFCRITSFTCSAASTSLSVQCHIDQYWVQRNSVSCSPKDRILQLL